jgi:bifunctional ADP-heptose synthase (sugar kinase/adenylyltransferase)
MMDSNRVDFSQLNILVLGDIFLDEYQFGECTRISQEAPVPIIKIDHTKTKRVAGGAGNVAANVKALGAKCTFGGTFGSDLNGITLCARVEEKGINTIPSSCARTTVKTRIIAQNQQVVRIDQEQNCPMDFSKLEDVREAIRSCDAIILSDYDKGYFTRMNAEAIIRTAKANNKLVVVDTKPVNVGFFEGADWFTPNLKEYQEMQTVPQASWLITKGHDGMECYYGEAHYKVAAVRREVADVAGAGDTVIAAFTLALAAKMSVEEAMIFANKAAGVVVGKQGTSTVTIQEIEALENEIYGIRIEDSP